MPDLSDVIKRRRSIRKYLPIKVPHQLIEDVLVAAGWAPSAHNSQPWRFIVLSDASVKQKLAVAMAEVWAADLAKDGVAVGAEKREERIERFANAPALILACSTMEGLRKFPDEKRQKCERDLAIQSLGAAMQNLLLAACSAGLGACWFCAPGFCKETVRKVLKIPEAVEPQALVIMGYPAETPSVPTKKLLVEYCFLDVWGGKF
ncbi:MAG TPA: nitroreductase family protein [Candidatus Binatia bacterium]|nr:nitroreductase family protein [Candidatus Binatia bacterium]